jgi:beta-mannosidase
MQRGFLSPNRRSRLPTNPARRHHGGAWWEHHATVRELFGEIEDGEMAILASQWLQAEALRYCVEETRRRWPRSGGIYPWQLNEPWPNVVCTSAVEYTGRPKLAYYAVRNAYRPTIATARYGGLKVAPGEPVKAEVWVVNDGGYVISDVLIELCDLTGRELAVRTGYNMTCAGNSSTRLPDLELPLPAGFEGPAILTLAFAGEVNRYVFSNRNQEVLRDMLQFPHLLTRMFSPDS